MKDTKIQPTLTSRELADLIQDVARTCATREVASVQITDNKNLLRMRDDLIASCEDDIEMLTRKLADALKALYPPGGVAVYGKNDSPKL